MASGSHTFMTGTVFTAERYQGNRLAIVAVRGNAITEKRKSLIAKEFGFSETVFIHDAPGPGQPRRVDIFTETGEEIPFAGHPIIGTAHYIFLYCQRQEYQGPADRENRQTAFLMTKAGRVPIFFNPYRQIAACAVPHNFHEHSARVAFDKVVAVQPQVQIVPTVEYVQGRSFPVVSLVRGMTFALIDLTEAPEVLAALKRGEAPEVKLDEEWRPSFIGCMYYERRESHASLNAGEPEIQNLHVRMITQGFEDPGTGSGNCALACYLALNIGRQQASKSNEAEMQQRSDVSDGLAAEAKNLQLVDKAEHHVFAVEQGLEMGRKCAIAVEVDIKVSSDGQRSVSSIVLSGRALFETKGELLGTYN